MISVVIPNYNYGRFLAQAIESSLDADEVIVVDDGSIDDSIAIAERYPVRLIRQKNRGVASARNRGAEEARGDIVAFLDADDYFLPGAMDVYRRAVSGDVDMVAVGFREEDVDGNEILIYKPRPLGWLAGDDGTRVFSGSVFCIRKDTFLKHRFDEDRSLHPSEDWEFTYRVSKSCRIRALDDIVMCYRNHGANVHLTIKNTENSMLAVYNKIFANGESGRRRSYASLYSILAGSYLYAKDYPGFVLNALKSMYYDPRIMLSRLIS